MSLEQALSETTKAINSLIAVLTKTEAITPVEKAQEVLHVNNNWTTSDEEVPAKPVETVETAEPPKKKEAKGIPSRQEISHELMLLAKEDRVSARAILTQFGCKHARELNEDQYADFLQAVKEKLAYLADIPL